MQFIVVSLNGFRFEYAAPVYVDKCLLLSSKDGYYSRTIRMLLRLRRIRQVHRRWGGSLGHEVGTICHLLNWYCNV
jgi:hypothetical protein